mgnify:CR=1
MKKSFGRVFHFCERNLPEHTCVTIGTQNKERGNLHMRKLAKIAVSFAFLFASVVLFYMFLSSRKRVNG